MDVTFRAANEEDAMLIAHFIAEEVERQCQEAKVLVTQVTLGENYRKEDRD